MIELLSVNGAGGIHVASYCVIIDDGVDQLVSTISAQEALHGSKGEEDEGGYLHNCQVG